MSDTTQTATPNERPAWLPEKFFDPETGEVRVEALARSYGELERRLGGATNAPARPDLPQSPDGYQLDVDDLLDVDPEVNQRLHAAGFSNDQAQLVYDLAAERLAPLMQQAAGDLDDARQMGRLLEHFGDAERFAAVRPQLRAWGEANLSPEVFDTLAGSAEGVIAIHAMMQNREPGLGGAHGPSGTEGEADLKRLMADPRYWRERDPAVVARVREGFRRLYPDA